MNKLDASTTRTTLKQWVFLSICRIPTKPARNRLVFFFLLAFLLLSFFLGYSFSIIFTDVVGGSDWFLN